MRSASRSKDRARAARRHLHARARRHRPSAYQIYVVAITAAIIGPLVWSNIATFVTPTLTAHWIGVWGPPLLLLALLGALRFGCWQGPVVFSAADVAFLLSAPIANGDLVRGRLLQALLGGAIVGALVALVVIVSLATRSPVSAPQVVAGSVGLSALGLLGVAGSWLMQISRRGWQIRRVGTPIVLLVTAGLVALPHLGSQGGSVSQWSGPWGWAIAPLAAHGSLVLAPALLVLASVISSGLALARADRCSVEQFLIRAETRSGIIASIGTLDWRTAELVRRSADQGKQPTLRSIALPRRPGLAVPWRDSISLLRNPARIAWGLALCAAGTWEWVTHLGSYLAAGLAVLIIYAAASRLVEPLRADIDYPDKSQLLIGRSFGWLLFSHCLLPVAALSLSSVLTFVCAVVTGTASWPIVGLIPVTVIPTIATIVLCVALSARRGGRIPLDVLLMSMTDSSGLGVVLWLAMWPIAALIVAGGPALYLSHALLHHGSVLPLVLQILLSTAVLGTLISVARQAAAPRV